MVEVPSADLHFRGNVSGNDQPGGTGFLLGVERRREPLWREEGRRGRCSVNLRQLSEMSRRWVIKERGRACARAPIRARWFALFVCGKP